MNCQFFPQIYVRCLKRNYWTHWPYLLLSETVSQLISMCVDVVDVDLDGRNCFSSLHISFGFVLAWLIALSTISRFASLIFATTLFLAALYKTQLELSRDFKARRCKIYLCCISERILSFIHFSESLRMRHSYIGICLSTTDLNIERKDDHILSISDSDLSEFQ